MLLRTTVSPEEESTLRMALTAPGARMKTVRALIGIMDTVVAPKTQLYGPLTRAIAIVTGNKAHMQHLKPSEWFSLSSTTCRLLGLVAVENTGKAIADLLRIISQLLDTREAVHARGLILIIAELAQLDFDRERLYSSLLAYCVRTCWSVYGISEARTLGLRLIAGLKPLAMRLRSQELRVELLRMCNIECVAGMTDCVVELGRGLLVNAADIEFARNYTRLVFRPISLAKTSSFVAASAVSRAMHANVVEVTAASREDQSVAKRRATVGQLIQVATHFGALGIQGLWFSEWKLGDAEGEALLSALPIAPSAVLVAISLCASDEIASLTPSILGRLWRGAVDYLKPADSSRKSISAAAGACACIAALLPAVSAPGSLDMAALIALLYQLDHFPPLSSGAVMLWRTLSDMRLLDTHFHSTRSARLDNWYSLTIADAVASPKTSPLPQLDLSLLSCFVGGSCEPTYSDEDASFLEDISFPAWPVLGAVEQKSHILELAVGATPQTTRALFLQLALSGITNSLPESIASRGDACAEDILALKWFANTHRTYKWSSDICNFALQAISSWNDSDWTIRACRAALSTSPAPLEALLGAQFPLKVSIHNAIAESMRIYDLQRAPWVLQLCIEGVGSVVENSGDSNDPRITRELAAVLTNVVREQSQWSRLRNAGLGRMISRLLGPEDLARVLSNSSISHGIAVLQGIEIIESKTLNEIVLALEERDPHTQLRIAVECVRRGASAAHVISWILKLPDPRMFIGEVASHFGVLPAVLLKGIASRLFRLYGEDLAHFPFDVFGVKESGWFNLYLSGEQPPPWDITGREARIPLETVSVRTNRSISSQALAQLSRGGSKIPKVRCDHPERAVSILMSEALQFSTAEEHLSVWNSAVLITEMFHSGHDELVCGAAALRPSGILSDKLRQYISDNARAITPRAFEIVQSTLGLLGLNQSGEGSVSAADIRTDSTYESKLYIFASSPRINEFLSMPSDQAAETLSTCVSWLRRVPQYHPQWAEIVGRLAATSDINPNAGIKSTESIDEALDATAALLPYNSQRLLNFWRWARCEKWIDPTPEAANNTSLSRLADAATMALNLPSIANLLHAETSFLAVIPAIVVKSQPMLDSNQLEQLVTEVFNEEPEVALLCISECWHDRYNHEKMIVNSGLVAEKCALSQDFAALGILAVDLFWGEKCTERLPWDLLDTLYSRVKGADLRDDLRAAIPVKPSLESAVENLPPEEQLDFDLVNYQFFGGTSAALSRSATAAGLYRLGIERQLDDYSYAWRLKEWDLPPPAEEKVVRSPSEVLFELFREEPRNWARAYQRAGVAVISEEQLDLARALNNIENSATVPFAAPRGLAQDVRQGRELTTPSLMDELRASCSSLRARNKSKLAVAYTRRLQQVAESSEELLVAEIEAAKTAWMLGAQEHALTMLSEVVKHPKIPNQADVFCTLGKWKSLIRYATDSEIRSQLFAPAEKYVTEPAQRARLHSILGDLCYSRVVDSSRRDELNEAQRVVSKGRAEVELQESSGSRTRLDKARTYLAIWETELSQLEVSAARNRKQCIQSYLVSLQFADTAKDEAMMGRAIAVWFANSGDAVLAESARTWGVRVPCRKYVPWLNQLTSRLAVGDSKAPVQRALNSILMRIGTQHPYHLLWPLLNMRMSAENNAVTVAGNQIWSAISTDSSSGDDLRSLMRAIEEFGCRMRDLARLKTDRRISKNRLILRGESEKWWCRTLISLKLPVPTAPLPLLNIGGLAAYKAALPVIVKVDREMKLASGLSAPKIAVFLTSAGTKESTLLKGGHDDLRQDVVMEQAFAAANSVLPAGHSMRTYTVLPLGVNSGAIEFVSNTRSLMDVVDPLHDSHSSQGWTGTKARQALADARSTHTKSRIISTYEEITENMPPVLHLHFLAHWRDPQQWLSARTMWARSTAVASIVGWVLGLGDRHCNNLMLDLSTGEVVHIDLGIAFDHGKRLRVPEVVPFRLTRDVVDGMGVTGTRGVFDESAKRTLLALRSHMDHIMTVLEVFRYDALYKWKVSTGRSDQDGEGAIDSAVNEGGSSDTDTESAEAQNALHGVRSKLTGQLSVKATVRELIDVATDPRKLALLFHGWFPFY